VNSTIKRSIARSRHAALKFIEEELANYDRTGEKCDYYATWGVLRAYFRGLLISQSERDVFRDRLHAMRIRRDPVFAGALKKLQDEERQLEAGT
jgi:hypothetical protein